VTASPSGDVWRALRAVRSRGQLVALLRAAWQQWLLWLLVALMVLVLLVTVIWLAGRHELEQLQGTLDRDATDAVSDLRSGLQRNVQSVRALQEHQGEAARWSLEAGALLRAHREWLRVEWRDAALAPLAVAETPYRQRLMDNDSRGPAQADVALACTAARKLGAPAYSPSHFVRLPDGVGLEAMELCVPLDAGGFFVVTYSLRDTLIELIGPSLRRGQEVAFTETDGTRLAVVGAQRRTGTRVFTSQQMVDLPGVTMMLRVDGWRAAPDLFPNVLTGLVTIVSIGLVSALILLARDTRRRLRVESDLADALAFRYAMEDSVITGLRARDLEGRTTYVNAAFCEMVGFSAGELISASTAAPYWPTELAHEYQSRQTHRLAGDALPPREGFESVFMRKDGSRFPVLIFEAPLINANGVQTGWMSAFLDISEQRRVEELSRASQERLQASARLATVGEMASLLSHELTQPLAAISSYATGSLNLLDGMDGATAADLSMAMQRIAQQAGRAGQVIRSVQDFVRRRDRAREAESPQALLDAVLPLIRMQARKLEVRLEVLLEPGLPDVMCDRTLVEQVLLNLARNAMQAMDLPELAQRTLTIRIAPEGEGRWLAFSVADVGAGIDAAVAERLFTPFFTTRSEGMGLGLSLCRTVVEQHGGELSFSANQPRGTIFRFTLPAAVPAPLS